MSHNSTSHYIFIYGNKKKKKQKRERENFPETGETVKKEIIISVTKKKRSSTHAHSHISATGTGKKIKANTEQVFQVPEWYQPKINKSRF